MVVWGEASLLQVKGYPPLLICRLVGSISVWFDFTLMFSSLAFYWHADARTVGVALALYGLPGLAVGPYLGALADRSQPAKAMALGYAARMIASMLLAAAPGVGIFVVLIFFKGLANVAMMPVEQVLTQRLLRKDQLVRNAGVVTFIDQFTKIGAPILAAAFSTWAAPAVGFLLSAGLALVGLAATVFLPRSICNKPGGATRPPIWSGMSAFATLLRERTVFRTTYLVALSQSAVLGFYDPLLALFLKEQGLPAGTFGVIVSCTAAGAIAGALVFRRVFHGGGHRLSPVSLVGFGLTVLLPGVLALAQAPMPLLGLYLSWVANGFFYGIASMLFMVTLQHEAPADGIGAVSSLARSTQLAVLVVGPVLGSGVASRVGIPCVFVLAGGCAIVSGLLLYAWLRRTDSRPAAA